MKNIPVALQAHLDSATTTMAFCWKVVRQDGVVQGFTEHDNDLTFDGVTYAASTGFTSSAIQSSLGLNVDNLNVDSALSSSTINEVDLSAGRYDAAVIELYWVNWSDVANVNMRLLISKGTIGEVKRQRTSFSAELRSLSQKTQQKTGRTFQRYCDAILGDSRCKVNLAALADLGTVASVIDKRTFTTTNISGATEFFSLGTVTFSSGPNSGLTFEIKDHVLNAGGVHSIVLWSSMPYSPVVGNAFTMFPGCKKDRQTCVSKFANLVNFQGFEFIPGNDAISTYPVAGGSGQDGRSIFGN